MYLSKSVLFVCLMVISAVAGPTVPKTDNKKKTSLVRDKLQPRFGEASESDGKGNKQLITTRFAQDGTAEEVCECMEFYECDGKGEAYVYKENE